MTTVAIESAPALLTVAPPKPRVRPLSASWIPRQHGAWTILLAGFGLGTAVGGISLGQAPLLGAVLAGFLARHAATRAPFGSLALASAFARQATADKQGSAPRKDPLWMARGLAAGGPWIGLCLFSLLFGGLGVVPVIFEDLWGLVPIGVIAVAAGVASVAIERRGGAFTPAGEALGILGLCLTAPAAEYAGAGTFTARTAGVGVLAAVFFLGGLLRVRYLVRHRRESAGPPRERFRAGWPSLAYQAAAVAAAAGLAAAVPDLLPGGAALALAPGALQAVGSVIRRRKAPEPVRRIGKLELVHAMVFVVMTVCFYGVPSSRFQVPS